MKVEKIQLQNGLKVLLIASSRSPVVSVQAWVNTGSADEQKGYEGVTHFIEHLLFKGTESFGVGQIASEVEAAGGEINAYTSYDQTVYYVTISKFHCQKALQVIYEMVFKPKFDAAEIDAEREVVVEEIKRGKDSPQSRAHEILFESVFKKHPYGRPIIGYEKVVKEISRAKILKYFQGRYSPKNVTVVISGDFEPKSMKSLLKETFGKANSKKLPLWPKRKKEQKLAKSKAIVEFTSFKQNILHLAWNIPDVKHKDIPALEVFASILGQGDSSRLMKRLRIESQVTQYTVAHTYTSKDPGIFIVSAVMTENNLDAALLGIREEMENILSEQVSNEEMQRALINMESEELYSLESAEGMARKFGSYEFYFKDPYHSKVLLKKLGQLKPSDVLAVARKYLLGKPMTAVYLAKEDSKDLHVEEALQKFSKASLQKTKTPQSVKKQIPNKRLKLVWSPKLKHQKPPEIKTLSSGTKVICWPQGDSPVINLRFGFMGGLRAEPKDRHGLSEWIARTWTAQTKNRSESQLQGEIESLAASIQSIGGRNTIGLSSTFLAPTQERVLPLIEDILCNPDFSEEILTRELHFMKEALKSKEDNPAQQAILQFHRQIFGTHPYGFDPLGTRDSHAALKPSDLQKFFAKIVSPQNLSISVVGDFETDKMLKILERWTQKLKESSHSEKAFQLQIAHDDLKESTYHFKKLDKEQTHLVYGFKGLSLTSPQRYALQVAQSILAGQGGRLFLELRDKASLAYSVSPLKMEGIETGYFGAYIACSPEKAAKAIEMMKAEFDKLVQNKVSEVELDRAKNYIIGSHDIDLQKTSAISGSLLFDSMYGISLDETLGFAEKIRSVTADSLAEVCQQLFRRPSALTVVGSLDPMKKSDARRSDNLELSNQ